MLKTVGKIIGWGLTALLSVMFIMAGGTKLIGIEMHVQNFAAWGFAPWFMYFVGLTEVICAGALWLRSKYAALGLTLVMAGAVHTHLVASEPFMVPAVLGVLSLFLAYLNRS
jgi:hypothetical protein